MSYPGESHLNSILGCSASLAQDPKIFIANGIPVGLRGSFFDFEKAGLDRRGSHTILKNI